MNIPFLPLSSATKGLVNSTNGTTAEESDAIFARVFADEKALGQDKLEIEAVEGPESQAVKAEQALDLPEKPAGQGVVSEQHGKGVDLEAARAPDPQAQKTQGSEFRVLEEKEVSAPLPQAINGDENPRAYLESDLRKLKNDQTVTPTVAKNAVDAAGKSVPWRSEADLQPNRPSSKGEKMADVLVASEPTKPVQKVTAEQVGISGPLEKSGELHGAMLLPRSPNAPPLASLQAVKNGNLTQVAGGFAQATHPSMIQSAGRLGMGENRTDNPAPPPQPEVRPKQMSANLLVPVETDWRQTESLFEESRLGKKSHSEVSVSNAQPRSGRQVTAHTENPSVKTPSENLPGIEDVQGLRRARGEAGQVEKTEFSINAADKPPVGQRGLQSQQGVVESGKQFKALPEKVEQNGKPKLKNAQANTASWQVKGLNIGQTNSASIVRMEIQPLAMLNAEPVVEISQITPFLPAETRIGLSSAFRTESVFQRPETAAIIARQLSEQMPGAQGQVVELRLNPQELGRVQMALSSTDETMVVSIVTERPETLALMRRHIEMLNQEFQRIGYTNVSFSFEGQSESKPQTDSQQHSKDWQTSTGETEPAPPQLGSVRVVQSGLDIRI